MNRNAKAAAEVTMMVRLRFVSRYRGTDCEKYSIYRLLFKAKSTTFFAEIGKNG